ncbi:hypothetical protein [Paenibacillus sp. Y412MC10]|nr:hypothetical protein [Paenibacillus sp. Y412MC10]
MRKIIERDRKKKGVVKIKDEEWRLDKKWGVVDVFLEWGRS